ncbi:hypothetical protein GHT09_018358 [Marmota monax]|uniref:Uncharacterized protein n=1 Tax=Marmota monax TaxID=9995 RepID=A0A834Q4F4_MARMO|nr:hypothetical protein GHT09_018358 [Marmota monax]
MVPETWKPEVKSSPNRRQDHLGDVQEDCAPHSTQPARSQVTKLAAHHALGVAGH